MKRLVFICFFCALAAGWAAPTVQAQTPPPPTPTLAPVLGPDPSATQTLQLQEFTRDLSYLLQNTTVYTTTSTGAAWAVERRVSYGEAAVVIMLMVVALAQIGWLVYYATTRGRFG